MPQMLRVSATPRVTQGTSTARERVVVYEGADSPRVALENVVIQATAAVKGMERTAAVPVEGEEAEEVPVDAEYEKVRDFCQRIIKTSEDIDRALTDQKGQYLVFIAFTPSRVLADPPFAGADFVKRLHASLPYIPRSSTVTAQRQDVETGATDEEIRRNYEAWAKGCRFEYCDLRVPQLAKSDKPVAYRQSVCRPLGPHRTRLIARVVPSPLSAFTSDAVALSGNNRASRVFERPATSSLPLTLLARPTQCRSARSRLQRNSRPLRPISPSPLTAPFCSGSTRNVSTSSRCAPRSVRSQAQACRADLQRIVAGAHYRPCRYALRQRLLHL